MFDNVALNVVIGLVFIYLLYSLFATVLSEIIATKLGLRARNLREAVDRMLNDEKEGDKGFGVRLWDSLKLMKNPKNPRITNFYNHPEIKYLGSTGIFKIPSQFKAVSFAKTVLNLLNETGYKKLAIDNNTMMANPDEGDIKAIPVTEITRERITAALEGIINDHERILKDLQEITVKEIQPVLPDLTALESGGKIAIAKIAATKPNEPVKEVIKNYHNKLVAEKQKIVLDHETSKYVLSLWKESYGDLLKFKLQLETWFDRTMEQCTEWYKRKIQIVLLLLGFLLAWFFNADTFTIISKLSTDKDARDKIVTLAAAYNQNTARPGEPDYSLPKEKIDSLNTIKNKLEQDIVNANTLLGLGGWLPDVVAVSTDPKTHNKIYTPLVDRVSLSEQFRAKDAGEIVFSTSDKWDYFLRLFLHHFWGFLVTAIAISLGAPFWFDLLNNLMQLRTSLKQETDSITVVTSDTISPLKRVG